MEDNKKTSLLEQLPKDPYQRIFFFLPIGSKTNFTFSHNKANALLRAELSKEYQKLKHIKRAPKRLHNTINDIFLGFTVLSGTGTETLAIERLPKRLMIKVPSKAKRTSHGNTALDFALQAGNFTLVEIFVTRIQEQLELLKGIKTEIFDIDEITVFFDESESKITYPNRDPWLHTLELLASYGCSELLQELYNKYNTPPEPQTYQEIIIIDILKYSLTCAASRGNISMITALWSLLVGKVNNLTYIHEPEDEKQRLIVELLEELAISAAESAIANNQESAYDWLVSKLEELDKSYPPSSPRAGTTNRFNPVFYQAARSSSSSTALLNKAYQLHLKSSALKDQTYLLIAIWETCITGNKAFFDHLLTLASNFIKKKKREEDKPGLLRAIGIAAFYGHREIIDSISAMLQELEPSLEGKLAITQEIKELVLYYAAIGGQQKILEHYSPNTPLTINFNLDPKRQIDSPDTFSHLAPPSPDLYELLTMLYNGHWEMLSHLLNNASQPEVLFTHLFVGIIERLLKLSDTPSSPFDPAYSYSGYHARYFLPNERQIEIDWLFESLEKLDELQPSQAPIYWAYIASKIQPLLNPENAVSRQIEAFYEKTQGLLSHATLLARRP